MAAKRLCHNVYLEFGFISSPYDNGIIPNETEACSKYIIATDGSGDIVGTVRICIGHSKTLNDWQESLYSSKRKLISNLNPDSIFEVEALAVRADYRGKRISWGLYKKALKLSQTLGLGTAIIGMDQKAYQSFVQLGWHVIQIGPPKYYYGSMTIPALLPINIQQSVVATRNQTYNKYLAA